MKTEISLKSLGRLFYIVDPREETFEKIEDVPDYVTEVLPLFIIIMFIEILMSLWKKKPNYSLLDSVGSISQGICSESAKLLFKGVPLAAYIWVYDNWRVTNLPWNSVWTWLICFIGVDFGYYWLHRASHEINILWAAHQVHHSSEYYNVTTAVRQSALQNYLTWMFYLPLALGIPPSVFLIHQQFNLIYQFWIHTELIRNLGPLEYILNTPRHHRVHHGRNRYCIDKNYAGTFIIWDRIFGTFECEEEEVVYGATHPVTTFDPFYLQLGHFTHIFKTFWEVKGFTNKLSVLFKGPGWAPGKPRLGLIQDIPDVHAPIDRYNPHLPTWCKVYVLVHFSLILVAFMELADRDGSFNQLTVICGLMYCMLSLTSFGLIMDKKYWAPLVEFARCLLYYTVDLYFLPSEESSYYVFIMALRAVFLFSALLWTLFLVQVVSLKFHKKIK
ncbi:alkylglycerol monooxygenase-like [Tachypleus tridentatus]|uniref:alkylglycerol monooxygenase-like n=1 Tax=Tachypleus tridentatus TaxID=6853 RepID=UPI003FD5F29F